MCVRFTELTKLLTICENPPNRLLFQNEIETRKFDVVITVVDNKKS